ncbi:MAG: serine protease [Bdellovibrionaceae bacterium]|nr:serine protease [Pseudobdellovibrionaceae bacterium]NUM59249.1 trypsin-like peptidase domain-containing protein [Pseudobdellovibrionaceae bacterium]
MKIYFRYKDQILSSLSPDINKNYTVGRGLNCDVQIPINSVSRFQGILFFQEGKWHFKNESVSNPFEQALTDNLSVNFKNGFEILLDTYLANEKTHFSEAISTKPEETAAESNMPVIKNKQPLQWRFVSVLSIVLTAFSILYYFQFHKPYDSKSLMGFADNKILKFELKLKKELIEKVKKEAELSESDFKESIGFCTGFLVEKNVILTAHHCVSPPPGFAIESDFVLKTNDNREIYPKKILGFDIAKDYLFLEVEGFNDNPYFNITEAIEVGQKVFTIGNVAGEGLAIREGIISGETEDANDPSIKYIRFSAAASPGNSGGPLLNEKGEVVALVSRKNMAENYNIGISYKDLRNGFQNFVLNRAKKEIIFDAKTSDLSYGGLEFQLAKVFRLPLIEKLESKPHIQENLKNFIVKFEVPFDFKDNQESYFNKFHAVAKNKIYEVADLIRKENLPGITWEQQTTEELPYVIPSATSDGSQSFKILADNTIVPKTLGLIGNSGYYGYDATLNEWKKEKLYFYNEGFMATKGFLIEERIKNSAENSYLVYSSVKDSKEALDISRYFVTSPDFSIVFLNPQLSNENKDIILKKTMKDIFIGPEGAIVSLKFFPFLRPKAKSDFKVKDFPAGIKKIKNLQDNKGRDWEYFIADFYDSFYIEFFCLENPSVSHCLSTFQEGSVNKLRDDIVKNFVISELSEKFPLMDFYKPKDLAHENMTQFLSHSEPFKKFKIHKDKKNNLKVKLDDFDYELNLGEEQKIISLRFIPGIKQELGKNYGEWSSFGVQFIRKISSKKEVQYELCTSGIQFDELRYNAMLIKEQLNQKNYRTIASEFPKGQNKNISMDLDKENVWKKNLGKDTRGWTKQAYGTCQKLSTQPESPDNLVTKFENRALNPE